MKITKRAAMLGTMALGASGAAHAARTPPRPFLLDFAPHEGQFAHSAGPDVLDQIAFAADHGFRGWEDNEAMGRPVAQQEAIARALAVRGMRMGVFVAGIPDWGRSLPVLTGEDEAARTAWLDVVRAAVPVAQRMNARWMTVVPGFTHPRFSADYQAAKLIDLLRRAADILEPHGLVMVIEPLNTRTSHPGIFVRTIDQAFALCRAVDSPSCKILADLFHEQIESGNLIPALERAWSEIAYIQVGDNPGRKEPTTGEINYANIFRYLREKSFKGIVGMEHGVAGAGKDGERALIEAYRTVGS